MPSRELILLSSYRFPAQHPLMLGSDDVTAFLNGYSALWHPAALAGASGPPRLGSPYDHDQPSGGHIYAVPQTPTSVLPDDWEQRARDAGAAFFPASGVRQTTMASLLEALRQPNHSVPTGLIDVAPDRVAAFLGIGFGYAMIETLFEAMDHQNLMSVDEFWSDIQQAVATLSDPDEDAYRAHLQSAADRLLAAREVLYPVTIYLLDLCLLDEQRLAQSLPSSFPHKVPFNLVAAGELLEKLGHSDSQTLAALREAVQGELVEVCGGPYREREDPFLPLESQIWNLAKGQEIYQQLLGKEVQVFGRKRFGFHPQLPSLLQQAGLRRALLLSFDESVVPTYHATVINWPGPDGKQVEAYTRAPHHASDPQVFFHWAHYLHKTIAQDHAATLALLHSGKPAAPWYDDLLELSRFAPVLGRWLTLSQYFGEVSAGEYASPPHADEFRGDYLSDRTECHLQHPVSGFAQHVKDRRRLDTAWTLAALYRGLAGNSDRLDWDTRLARITESLETGVQSFGADLEKIEKEVAATLTERLVSRASKDDAGYLLLNPCSFTRRVALELEGMDSAPPAMGPLKASQVDGGVGKLVIEVPALGFAWIPRAGATPDASSPGRMRLADPRTVRNEFFEAEIDPVTGGLRSLRDHRTRVNRLGQQLVYNPGSTMRAREIRLISSGPAVGEILAEGVILDERNDVLAEFRQRYRAWLGRPVLEIKIEIIPQRLPRDYPWHSYYGARFAWGDERAALLRGVDGSGALTNYTRPETPDFLEIRSSRHSTVLFPGGLPFHQRHAGRMLDMVLIPEGETARHFEIGVGLDRDYPMQTALGMVTPVPCVPTSKGPPHIGATGWLFHLDMPNLLLSSMKPAPDSADAVLVRLLECNRSSGHAELRCVRNPRQAMFVDRQGSSIMDASTSGDNVHFEIGQNDLVQLRIEFS